VRRERERERERKRWGRGGREGERKTRDSEKREVLKADANSFLPPYVSMRT
jgi:hypothetical protein